MTTVGEWQAACSQLPRLDRELLLADALGRDRAAIIAHPELPIPAGVRRQLADWRDRRVRGEPLAYIIGRREFWGLSLAVNPNVLIPRPETELLVEQALARTEPSDRVLDLGTGCGAIAIAMAAERQTLEPRARPIVGSDVAPAALAVARRNATHHGVAVHWQHSNWFDALVGPFDAIVSNPPYIAAGDTHLHALHDPSPALIAGPTGLEAITHIVTTARTHLAPHGWLLLEHGSDQGAAVRALLSERGYRQVAGAADLAGRQRVSWGRAPA